MLTRHGILRERFADTLTDALRAAILRQAGYRVDVVEFVGSEHTPATRCCAPPAPAPPSPAARCAASTTTWCRRGECAPTWPSCWASRVGEVPRRLGTIAAGAAVLTPLRHRPGRGRGAGRRPGGVLLRRPRDRGVERPRGRRRPGVDGQRLRRHRPRLHRGHQHRPDRRRRPTGPTGPTDVEALAPAGPGHVWVGDIGDNTGSRGSVQVTRVPVGDGDRTVDEETIDLVYPDGPRDAEALLADPTTGRLLVVTKGVFGGEVYAAPPEPADDAPNQLGEVGQVIGLVTDGAFFPDGRHLVLRTYSRATVYTCPDLESLGSWDLPAQPQGEGVAVAPDGSLLLSTEGQGTEVLSVPVPPRIRAGDGRADPERGRPEVSVGGDRRRGHPGPGRHRRRDVVDRPRRPLPRGLGGGRASWASSPWGCCGAACARTSLTPCLACAAPPPTSRAGPAAVSARASPTSTSTGSVSGPRRSSAARTWSSRRRGRTCGSRRTRTATSRRSAPTTPGGGSTSTTRSGARAGTRRSSSGSSTSARRCPRPANGCSPTSAPRG